MNLRSILFYAVCIISIQLLNNSTVTGQTTSAATLSSIKQGQKLNGFSAVAVYQNDANQPMGGRFVHDRTGFTLDLLQIESVPQTYIWVNSLPLSNKGEPHTQEHLLITKGNKGHALNTREGMSLAFSNAFTQQTYTAYHFNTAAGGDVFYTLFAEYLDALLHPDYSDEEVHREVCNWGVAEDAATGQLKIEEKGSVYNEMKTSMNNLYSVGYNAMGKLLYGNTHPLSYNAGGDPADIRILNAADIKKFHDLNYHLGNMGAITSLPRTMTLASVLDETDKILTRLQPTVEKHAYQNNLPAPKPAPGGTIKTVDYPSANAQDPGLMLISYPAQLNLGSTDMLLLNVFLGVFAGDASTNLYKKFIDSKTRVTDLGAQGTYAYADSHQGQPVYMALTDVNTASLTPEKAAFVIQGIMAELKRIASFKDGSPGLKEFNQRIKNSLIEYKRFLAKFTNTPPKFGYRDTYESWYLQVQEMARMPGFQKSVVMKPQCAEIDKLLSTDKNIWGNYIDKWKLTNTMPYVVLSKANANLLAQQDSAAKERAAAEVAVLKAKYKVSTDQEAIHKYKEEYDANTLMLEKAEAANTIKFIDNPPLTLDDPLDFKTMTLANKIPITISTFNNMTSASTGLALRVDVVPADKLVYLAMLPELLTQTGIIKNGKAVSYEDMMQQQRQQILGLSSYFAANSRLGRVELVIKGSGNNVIESQRSVQWMNDVLQGPNWTMENISRLRDLVDQTLSAKRKTMQSAEEIWVNDPAYAYRAQDKPLILATNSVFTETHNVQRLRWMLMDGGNTGERNEAAAFLDKLGAVSATRADLQKLLAQLQNINDASKSVTPALQNIITAFSSLPAKAKSTAVEATRDLEQTLNDIPDGSLIADWQYLCRQMKHDLLQTPEKTLAELNDTRKALLHTGNARMFEVSSSVTQAALQKNINALIAGLSAGAATKVSLPSKRIIDERVKQRLNTTETPVYVGLVNPNSATGVFINSVILTTYADTSREKLLQYLAAQLFAGAGKQSVYTKSTGAGLSYSTGVGTNPASGNFRYYAERTPLLPQTLGFVIDEIKKTPNDPAMSEYIISMAVSSSRASSEYEGRGEAIASDLVDGITPAVVSNFRKAILLLRRSPTLMEEVYKRKDAVYEKILPGYGVKMKDVKSGNYMVIGAEKQMEAYEKYLQSKEGASTKLYRIYPRDFWMTQ